ncbi:MAG: YggS family pyridoxal phosphate-dependent enzyme [Firmicutes bacterium]|nr:YggS family pyridoxal phosphate-dependent enzyme [Bacillota bacterium]
MTGRESLERNLADVRERIAAAAIRSGRDPGDVTLVAVTKTVPADVVMQAVSLGVTDVGENRVQEALLKHGTFGGAVRWHMVGHLQSNKAAKAVRVFDVIHSVDRLSLAEELDRLGRSAGTPVRALVQVNVSGEETKFGLPPAGVEPLLRRVSAMRHLAVEGLMTIAPFTVNPEETRPFFRGLRQILERVNRAGIPGVNLRHLSMGMTNDYEVAIEEGATIVRIGTAIFGPRLA